MSDRRDRFVWDEDEFNAILEAQQQQAAVDPRLQRYIDAGLSIEEAKRVVELMGNA